MQHESMEVGDHHFGFSKFRKQIHRDQVMLAVIVVRVRGQQHAQPVTNGNAWRADQKGVRKAVVLRAGQFVQCLPGDQHGNYQGLAAARGHLKGHAIKQRIGCLVCLSQAVFNPGITIPAGDFGYVNCGFECFDLTKEQAVFALRVGPILQQTTRNVGHPLIIPLTPDGYPFTDAIDEFIFLKTVCSPFCIKRKLFGILLAWLRNGNEIRTDPARFDDLIGDAVF